MASDFKKALKVTSPVFLGYFPAGIAFGVLAGSAGIPWYFCILMSILTYSGAAQYAAIPLVASGQSVTSVGINTFGINLRHIFYALPLIESLPKNFFKRNYCLFALTDECFSVMTTLPEEERAPIFLKAAFLMHMYWVWSGALGVALSGILSRLIPNLEFAMPCLFVVLWFEQVQQNRLKWPSFLALAAFALTIMFVPAKYVLLAALGLCVVGILTREVLLVRAIKEEVQEDEKAKEDAQKGEQP